MVRRFWLGLLLAGLIHSAAVAEQRTFRVFHAENGIDTGDGIALAAGPEYYINGGADAGLQRGMRLTAARSVEVGDDADGSRHSVTIAFATVEVVRVYPAIAIARTLSIEPVSEEPIVSPRAVMVGDRLTPAPPPPPSTEAGPRSEVVPRSVKSDRIVLPSAILFGFDSARLTEAGRQALNRIQTSSRGPFSGAVRVEGHTCDMGDESYNLMLSAKRARSVAAYLARAERFAGSPISTAALGEWSPAFPNDGDANRAANRRVELILTPAGSQTSPTP